MEWKFRHIYRGQPRRHLLTTGWSAFVGHKRLVSGDAVLFLSGNGELRLGIRRAAWQHSRIPSSVLSSQSMHLGLHAAAAHAVATNSMFHIFYNPRTSPTEFVIPYSKYVKGFSQQLSTGMQFKMRFETEDAAERRCIGTITGISDIEPSRWPGSKWRSLEVEWDDHAANERQERVSAWEIEPFISTAGWKTLASPRIKRLRTSLQSTPTDLSICDGDRSLDFGEFTGFQKVLQGQELVPLREELRGGIGLTKCQEQEDSVGGNFVVPKTGMECESSGKCHMPPPSELFSTNKTYGPLHGSGVLQSVGHSALQCTDTNQQCPEFNMQLQARSNFNSQELKTINYGSTGLEVPFSSFHLQQVKNTKSDLVEMPVYFGTCAYWNGDLSRGYGNSIPFGHASLQIGVPGAATIWKSSFVSPSELMETKAPAQEAEILSSDFSVGLNRSIQLEILPSREHDHDEVKGKQECKLFGFSLIEESTCLDRVVTTRISSRTRSNDLHGALAHQIQSAVLGKLDKPQKVSDKHRQQMIPLKPSKQEANLKNHVHIQTLVQTSGCTRTKVHKQGNAVGRVVDLSKLDGYDELLSELERLFNMEGLLTNPKNGWQVVYTDSEGDLMLVGDDPWMEFRNIACKILIYTLEEIQKITPAHLTIDALSCSEDQSATMEVSRCSIHHNDSSSRITT